MKTLQDIKDEVAKENGTDWGELMSDCGGNPDDIQDYTDEVTKRYADNKIDQAIKWCEERIKILKNNEDKGYGSELIAIDHYETFKYFLKTLNEVK